MSGGGIGSAIGTGLGVMLAPATGGMSMLIPALGGAAGGALGSALTGGNPLMDALMGGIGGGLTGGLSGGAGGIDGIFGTAGSGALDGFGNEIVRGSAGDLLAGAAGSGGGGGMFGGFGSGIMDYLGSKDPLSLALAGNSILSSADSLMNPPPKYDVAKNANDAKNTTGFNSQLPKYTMQNTATPYTGDWYKYGQTPQSPMYNAMPVPQQTPPMARGGMVGYAAGGAVSGTPGIGASPIGMTESGGGDISPEGIYNLLSTLQGMKNKPQGQPQMQPPQGAQPARNPLVPMPTMPMSPQGQMQPNSVQQMTPAGQMQPRGYAMGGNVLPMQSPMPRPAMPPQMQGQQPNPLAAMKTAHAAGKVIGQALAKRLAGGATTPDGRVAGKGTGQSDSVPAKLSVDEYIVPADVVSKLGDGSSQAGGDALDHMVKHVRKHKAVKGFPPKAHNPLAYIPKKGAKA